MNNKTKWYLVVLDLPYWDILDSGYILEEMQQKLEEHTNVVDNKEDLVVVDSDYVKNLNKKYPQVRFASHGSHLDV